MDMEEVTALFVLFSGETDTEISQPLVRAAIAEVCAALRQGADVRDERLCYLAAAVANVQYRTMLGARDRTAVFAGTAAGGYENRMAEHLAAMYRGLCAELLEDASFYFLQTGGRDDGID